MKIPLLRNRSSHPQSPLKSFFSNHKQQQRTAMINQSLNLAFKYTEESVEKCRQLADFLKKRQEIEDEYAKSLRKLCKSVSLKPLKKQGWFSRKTSSRADEGEEEVQNLLLKSDLWSTFYEIVDDTSQIAKAHAILSESIANQIVAPFEESIRNMDLNRRRTWEESSHVLGELNEAFSILKKATQQLEDSTNEVNAARLGLSRAEGAMTVKPRDLDRAKMKYQSATEKLSIARASYRQCDDVCRSLQNKVQMVDVPRISRMLSGLEAARGAEVRSILQSATRLDKQTAEMGLQCAAGMEMKVNAIGVDDALDNLMSGNLVNGSEGGPATVEDTRRYSITRPLISRAATSHPVALNDNPNFTPRTLAPAVNPSPSYYPSATYKASIEALERKTTTTNSQIIQ